MGTTWSYFSGGQSSAEFKSDPFLDVVDEATGLTPRQTLVVRETWNVVQKDLQQTGVDLFLALFREYPSYQNNFKALADLQLEELPSSKKLRAHATNVMYALTAVVDNLDDVGCLVELLLKYGENHARHEVVIEQFENLKTVYIKLMQEKLGDTFTPFAQSAWENTWRVLNSKIEQGMKRTVEDSTSK